MEYHCECILFWAIHHSMNRKLWIHSSSYAKQICAYFCSYLLDEIDSIIQTYGLISNIQRTLNCAMNEDKVMNFVCY